jgi:chemotaxis protein methyltransferase CheR
MEAGRRNRIYRGVGSVLIHSTEVGDDALAEISLILKNRRNFCISIYKDTCMRRRIAIRIRSCRCPDADAYSVLLQQSDQELDLLKKTLTIHVSQFFRNPSMFNKLHTAVLPNLFHAAESGQKPLRIWSLGCAGGEEAYSLGILIREYFPRQLLHVPVEIHAFDIDADILQTAIKGEYSEDRLKDLPAPFRERYFSETGSRLQLSQEIREMVTFHHRSIVDVTTMEPCQLALCRNTLIYFTRPDQENFLHSIAHILPTNGILVLGKSETLVGETRKYFTTVCPVERIYRKN